MIYLLCKTGKVDFDETRLLVVRAQSEEEARGIGSEKGSGKAWKLRGETGLLTQLKGRRVKKGSK